MASPCSNKQAQLICLIITGVSVCAVLLILFLFNYPSYARRRVVDEMVFRNGSDSIERFRSTQNIKNLQLAFYLYNVTNPHEVTQNSSKVRLQEIGPFVYSELKVKEFIVNDQDSGLITYKLRTKYVFMPGSSVSDPKKISITWPNVPLLVAKAYLDKLPSISRMAAYWALNRFIKENNEPAFISDTADSFLFSGSKRQLFDNIQKLDYLKFINPWPLRDNRFGLLYGKNNTWTPELDYIYTNSAGFGKNQSYDSLNEYIFINNSRQMPFWQQQPPECNKIGGTDGEFFSPFLDEAQDIQVYSATICRKVSLRPRQNSYVHGIRSINYCLDEKSLMSGQKFPPNQCYCLARGPSGEIKPECQLDGLIDLANCIAPNMVASGVRFIYGSPALSKRIEGLAAPDEADHGFHLYVEPNTGLTLKERVPIQFNVRMEKNNFEIFSFFNDVEPLILPIAWVVETSTLTDDQASLLRSKLLLLDSWLVVMVLGGAIFFILAIIVMSTIMCYKYRESRTTPSGQATEVDPLIEPTIRAGNSYVQSE